jgi:hypothetical protein
MPDCGLRSVGIVTHRDQRRDGVCLGYCVVSGGEWSDNHGLLGTEGTKASPRPVRHRRWMAAHLDLIAASPDPVQGENDEFGWNEQRRETSGYALGNPSAPYDQHVSKPVRVGHGAFAHNATEAPSAPFPSLHASVRGHPPRMPDYRGTRHWPARPAEQNNRRSGHPRLGR